MAAVTLEDAQGRTETVPLTALQPGEALGPTAHHPFWPWLDAWLHVSQCKLCMAMQAVLSRKLDPSPVQPADYSRAVHE